LYTEAACQNLVTSPADAYGGLTWKKIQVVGITKLVGVDEISVPDAAAVVNNEIYKGALKTGYATSHGHDASNFTKFDLSLPPRRRLRATDPRMLSAGKIRVDYEIDLVGVSNATAVATKAKTVDKTVVTQNVVTELQKVNYPNAEQVVVETRSVVHPPKATTTTRVSAPSTTTSEPTKTAPDTSTQAAQTGNISTSKSLTVAVFTSASGIPARLSLVVLVTAGMVRA
jgi:hypothetical protein